MPERIGNSGYIAFGVEATKGTAVVPSLFVPLYDESLSTAANFVEQEPAYGNKHAVFTTLQGQRSHSGDLTLLAEPNTTAYLMDMLYTKSSTTGAGPYTHSFILSNTVNPKSYTVDISTGNGIKRFLGVEISKYSPSWNDNELQHKLSVSGLASFQSGLIASVAAQVITLDTAYDPTPTRGLVVGDLTRLYDVSAEGTGTQYIDVTITALTATTVTVTGVITAIAAGDFLYLRPATPAFTLLQTFLWAKTEWRFGATATAALTASQLRVEQGSTFELMHNFEDDKGALRSGAFDPAALVRTTGEESLKVKKFFDNPNDMNAFMTLAKGALVIRHFAGPTNQFEFRVTFNNIKTDNPMPTIKPGEVNYSNIDYHVNYDQTDGKALQIDVINNLATV